MVCDLIRAPLEVFGASYSFGTVLLDFSVAAFWTVSVPVNFLTGFYVHGLVEMRPKMIAWRYARTWLMPDLVLVCVDWFIWLMPQVSMVVFPSPVASALRLVRFVRLFRSVRILKHVEIVTP